MSNWQEFEINATKLMNNVFKDSQLNFENAGGSDSTSSDIKIRLKDKDVGSIEAKYDKPQCGQITVKHESNHFTYSGIEENINKFTIEIIKHLNNNYERYKDYSTTGIDVTINKAIIDNWVKTYYLKKSNWLIYSKNKNNLTVDNVLLIPIQELDKYFKITASFRIKRSGSTSSISVKNKKNVKKIISKFLENKPFTIEEDEKKLYIVTKEEIGKTNLEDGYFISEKKDGKFGVTKRNQTEDPNPNVMFTLKLKEKIEFKAKIFKDTYQ